MTIGLRRSWFVVALLLAGFHFCSPSVPALAQDPFGEDVAAESPADPGGEILTVKGSTIVVSPGEGVTVSVGDRFEIVVELPGDLGLATVASGKVISTSDGIVMGKIESKDARAKVATSMSVRFLTSADHATASSGEAAAIPHVTKRVEIPTSVVDFRDVVQRYRKAVFVVKDAQDKAHGTAFTISKEHRLLVTNAHVADFASRVVLNESRTVYKVVKRWYHPDTIRKMLLDQDTMIRSWDPTYGKVDPRGTDLAILELEKLGPDLPAEVVLAPPVDLSKAIGAEVGTIGFPAYDTQAAPDQFAQATFGKGSINRFERLNGHSTDQALKDRRWVQYSVPNYPGVSGSPVFLANGDVIVVANAVETLKDGGKIAHGTRVDALWDLLAHFKLTDKVPGAPESLPEPVFIANQNPAAVNLLKAVEELNKAEQLKKEKQYTTSLEYVANAEKLAPNFWRVYYVRGGVCSDYVRVPKLSQEERIGLYEASLNAFIKAEELHFKSFQIHPVELLLEIARQSINSARQTNKKEHLERAANLLGNKEITRVALEGNNAAYFLALRASIQRDLGNYQPALDDINQALQLRPTNSSYQRELERIQRASQR